MKYALRIPIIALLLSPAPLAAQQPVVLTLGAAARMAADHGAGPEAARQRVAQAEARVRQRKGDFLPTVSGAAGVNERTFNSASFGISFPTAPGQQPLFDPDGQVLGPVKGWDVRGTIRQNLFDPASFARLRAARATSAAAGSEASVASQQAAAVAAGVYIRALRADAQISARLADSTLASQLLGIADAQLSAGVGVQLDVTRARAQVSSVHSQLVAARAERDRARVDLARALGLPLGTPLTLADSLFGLPTTIETPAEASALQRARTSRADIRATGEQLAAAQRSLDAIKAERLPSLGAFADQGGNGKGVEHLLSTYTWGIQVSVPIFDGFKRDGRLDEQRAAIQELDIRRRDVDEQAAADIRVALLDLQAARDQLAAADERFGFAEQELTQARDRFSAGVSGNADVVTASLSVNAARMQIVDARASLQAARVALARAQGSVTELP